jgi:hypothetical protein
MVMRQISTVILGMLGAALGCAYDIPPEGSSGPPDAKHTITFCATADEEGSLTLTCPSGQVVVSIDFASYGQPIGSCGSFSAGSCNSSASLPVVASACLGKASCTVNANNATFGDPCHGNRKNLAMQASCGDAEGGADSGSGGADAGSGSADSGSGSADSGSGGVDSGSGGVDSGSGGVDSGSGGADAGSGGADAGPGGADAGAVGADSGFAGYYTWPAYNPNIAYDYVDEFGTLSPPTSVKDDCSGVAGTYAKGWWAFRYGAKRNPLVTSAAWVPMIDRFNSDFSYITDVMRWPRDGRARNGNYSAIYLYGSGLCTDSASNTATGGWQSWVGDGPIVLASYYPVYSFDPACTYADKTAQQGAMIHEGIHSILATMPGVKKACWFHEGGNTWLQSVMEVKRSGVTPTQMGWLSAGAAIAPFMPIETYSGWLQDGSFGGPCAERVNMTNSSGQQVCTWRRLLGGTQYGEAFPHALEVMLGEKSIAWIWRYCQASGRVLQDLAEVTGGLGPTQTRRLIQEYRARQAFGDFGKWSAAYKKLLNDNWKVAIDPEWSPYWINAATWTSTCYVATTQSGSTLTPEEQTLPGWSGANQIPLTVSPGATSATVAFSPAKANMSCQLVYQDARGGVHYGAPVSSGACSVPLSDVKNNVVVAVIANTDYVYDGGTTKYGYTLTLGSGVSGKADIYSQWYR